MSKWILVDSEHLNDTWRNSKSPNDKISNTGDQEYINLWKEHYSDFSGKILEISTQHTDEDNYRVFPGDSQKKN